MARIISRAAYLAERTISRAAQLTEWNFAGGPYRRARCYGAALQEPIAEFPGAQTAGKRGTHRQYGANREPLFA